MGKLRESRTFTVISDYVTIYAGMAAASPVCCCVIFGADAGSGGAEKGVLVGIYDETYVPRPDDEVSGLWPCDEAKLREADEDRG